MHDILNGGDDKASSATVPIANADRWVRHLRDRFANAAVTFRLTLPDGNSYMFGQGRPAFEVAARNTNGVRALKSLDEGCIADAYIIGDIDIFGDLLQAFALRSSLTDAHFVIKSWRFVYPLLFGRRRNNRKAVESHYERDAEFFLRFLEPVVPLYTQGIFADELDSLEAGALRKLEFCYRQCRLQPGNHILEVGPGWGAWFKFASQRGIRCTGITLSQKSISYLCSQSECQEFGWELVLQDFLDYETDRKFDAVVMMGVIEHLPQYRRVVDKIAALLKPGGYAFIDGSACDRKYELASSIVKHIFPGNHSLLVLHKFIEVVAQTPLEVHSIANDRHNYFLTLRQWGMNLDSNRVAIIERFGQEEFRKFRLYLWGAVDQFQRGDLSCYRIILRARPD